MMPFARDLHFANHTLERIWSGEYKMEHLAGSSELAVNSAAGLSRLENDSSDGADLTDSRERKDDRSARDRSTSESSATELSTSSITDSSKAPSPEQEREKIREKETREFRSALISRDFKQLNPSQAKLFEKCDPRPQSEIISRRPLQNTCDMDVSNLHKALKQGIVQVTIPGDGKKLGSAGTGFLACHENTCGIVTNEHVIRGGKSAIIASSTTDDRIKEYNYADILYEDKATDIAVLAYDPMRFPYLIPIPISATEAKVNDAVLTIGHSRGEDQLVVSAGRIDEIDYLRDPIAKVISTNQILQGNSGGILANKKGELVGVTTKMFESCGTSPRCTLSISLDPVKTALKKTQAPNLDSFSSKTQTKRAFLDGFNTYQIDKYSPDPSKQYTDITFNPIAQSMPISARIDWKGNVNISYPDRIIVKNANNLTEQIKDTKGTERWHFERDRDGGIVQLSNFDEQGKPVRILKRIGEDKNQGMTGYISNLASGDLKAPGFEAHRPLDKATTYNLYQELDQCTKLPLNKPPMTANIDVTNDGFVRIEQKRNGGPESDLYTPQNKLVSSETTERFNKFHSVGPIEVYDKATKETSIQFKQGNADKSISQVKKIEANETTLSFETADTKHVFIKDGSIRFERGLKDNGYVGYSLTDGSRTGYYSESFKPIIERSGNIWTAQNGHTFNDGTWKVATAKFEQGGTILRFDSIDGTLDCKVSTYNKTISIKSPETTLLIDEGQNSFVVAQTKLYAVLLPGHADSFKAVTDKDGVLLALQGSNLVLKPFPEDVKYRFRTQESGFVSSNKRTDGVESTYRWFPSSNTYQVSWSKHVGLAKEHHYSASINAQGEVTEFTLPGQDTVKLADPKTKEAQPKLKVKYFSSTGVLQVKPDGDQGVKTILATPHELVILKR